MKKFSIIIFSIFTLLVSCKCKKASTEMSADLKQSEVTNNTNSQTSSASTTNTTEVTTDNKTNINNQEQGLIVSYEANTRGYFMKLKFSNNQLAYTKVRDNDNLTPVNLTKTQIDELNALLLSIKLESLPNLKDPTQKRFYDGAAIAHLSVIKDGKEYTTTDFDHGIPPAEIEKFVKTLLAYTEK